MADMWVTVLMVLSAAIFAGAVGLMGMGVANITAPFFIEVREESAGGVAGAGSVVVRKLGVMNRRILSS